MTDNKDLVLRPDDERLRSVQHHEDTRTSDWTNKSSLDHTYIIQGSHCSRQMKFNDFQGLPTLIFKHKLSTLVHITHYNIT